MSESRSETPQGRDYIKETADVREARHRSGGKHRRSRHVGAPPAGRFDASNPPRQVGWYRVGDKVGAGGSGVAHEAHHLLTRKPAVIKFDTHDPGDPSIPGASTVPTEGKILQMIQDPNILKAKKTGTFVRGKREKHPYVITELAKEGSLHDLLQERTRLSIGESSAIGAQIAGALETTHAKWHAHGDVKPGNIFVTKIKGGSAEVVLGDFGTAGTPRKLPIDNMTAAYAAPEQFRQRITFASDVYSLGAILFELETGERLFKPDTVRGDVLARLIQVSTQENHDTYIQSRLAILKDISPETVRLLEGMLQLNPDDRPDATTVKTRLLELSKKYSNSSDVTVADAQPVVAIESLHEEKNSA